MAALEDRIFTLKTQDTAVSGLLQKIITRPSLVMPY